MQREAGSTRASSARAGLEIAAFVQRYFGELTAYGREARLYPPDHPRLRSRVSSMTACLLEYARASERGLSLHARDGTLFSRDRPVEGDPEIVQRFAALLRRRMVALVRVESEVAEDEARRLADRLVAEGDPLDGGPAEERLGAAVTLYRQSATFGDGEESLSEDEIVERARNEGAETGTRVNDHPAFARFSSAQLRAIDEVLRQPVLGERLRQVLDPDGGVRFPYQSVAKFFAALDLPAQIDRDRVPELLETALACLGFLEDLRGQIGASGCFPVTRLAAVSAGERPLGEAVRWRLARRFIPAELIPAGPVASGDSVGSRREASREESPLDREVLRSWVVPDLEALRREVSDQLEPDRLQVELARAAASVALKRLANEREVLGALVHRFEAERANLLLSVEADREILAATEPLPPGISIRWQSRILPLIAVPERALEALSGGEERLKGAIVENPPVSLSTPYPAPEARDGSRGAEILRQILCRGGAWSLDAVLHIIAREEPTPEGVAGWRAVFQELAASHGELDRWIETRAVRLCRQRCAPVLTALPIRSLERGFERRFHRASTKEQLAFVGAMERLGTPVAIQLLIAALEFPSEWVRRVALGTLGAQEHRRAYEALTDLLERLNASPGEWTDPALVCNLLARYQGEEGRRFLERICREKKGFFHKWRRPIRRQANRALASWRTRGGKR